MKKGLHMLAMLVFGSLATQAQVTQLNNNASLNASFPISNTKTILVSGVDSSLWITDATPAGTTKISSTVRFKGGGALLNGKLIFSGHTDGTGVELYITDGTTAGTTLLKDIYSGAASSYPDEDFAILNGYIYFTAETAAHGRELWRTNGTAAGTELVKDIIPGTTGSNTRDDYELFSNGSYLLLNVKTTGDGTELWKSDGTSAGTSMLKDINPGTASSNADNFYKYGNIILFAATTAAEGFEMWRTDGTPAGTYLVKDINPGPANSFNFLGFYPFNGKLYFNANNGTAGEEIWSTDGTPANTTLLKDIAAGPMGSMASLFYAIKVGNKFIFSAMTLANGFELWESDGTAAGTKLFMDIVPGNESSMAYVFPSYDFSTEIPTQPLYNGKFFFMATTEAEGSELWISDGTPGGTSRLKDIYPGDESGVEMPAYIYTTSGLYFTANNGTTGNELWKSDGTPGGTTFVAEINPGPADADIFFTFYAINNKILFEATNGDDPTATDLYRIDVDLATLPVVLHEFTVRTQGADAMVTWSTSQEINSKDFLVQRSYDGTQFTTIGTVAAAGTSSTKRNYQFADVNALNIAADVLYYRLVSNDKDGKSSTSRVIAVRLKGKQEWTVKLNNNPVVADVQVTLAGITSGVQLSIADVSGKVLYRSASVVANGQINVPASQLPRGLYVLVAESNGVRKSFKFVKQ